LARPLGDATLVFRDEALIATAPTLAKMELTTKAADEEVARSLASSQP